MARQLRVFGAGVDRPDERHLPNAQKQGPAVCLRIVSEDLRARPVHVLRLTQAEALSLLADLARAVNILHGNQT
jgi:hypothetical protein